MPHAQSSEPETMSDGAAKAAPPALASIEAAAVRLAGRARPTPLLASPALDALAQRQIWVKAECLQRTGSFKVRGAWNAILAASPKGVVTMSSGNHAQAVAFVAKHCGIPAAVVMPSDAPEVKVAATQSFGADIVLYDRRREDRDALARGLAEERGWTLIPPFDSPEVIAGQGTIGLELAGQAAAEGIAEADVLVPCSGGGLAAGIALALSARAPGLKVRTVEPEGFDDMARSLASGEVCRNERPQQGLCDALLAPRPGILTLPILRRLAGPGLTVRDEQVLFAMRAALEHLKIVLEPGGAVALAAALFTPGLGPKVIAIGSGGNVAPEILARALALAPARAHVAHRQES